MVKEDELLAKLATAEKELVEARSLVKKTKRAVLDAETQLISAKLNQERLQEQYRVFKSQQVRVSDENKEIDSDLERFRLILPGLLEKIK